MSQRIHRLIELNLVAGANFSLGWVRKWHSKLNFNTISRGLPRVHMDATLEPARRIIAKLLEADVVSSVSTTI
jgi:hypothetical protein